MNGKIIVWGLSALAVIGIGLPLVIPMISDVLADPAIDDFTGLAPILGLSVTVVVLVVLASPWIGKNFGSGKSGGRN